MRESTTARRDIIIVAISRAVLFFVLFAISLQFHEQSLQRTLIFIYGLSTVLPLSLWLLAYKTQGVSPVGALLYFQHLLELGLESALLVAAGGFSSSFGLVFILTILTGGLFFRFLGAVTLALCALAIFILIGFAHLNPHWGQILGLESLSTQFIQIQTLLYASLFFMVAFLSSHFSNRLRLANAELKGTQEKLDEYQFSAESMMNSAPNGLLFFDSKGYLKYWNEAASAFLSIQLNPGVGVEDCIPNTSLPIDLWKNLDHGINEIKPEEFEFNSGQYQPLHVLARSIRKDGYTVGYLFTLIDFTEQKRMERAVLRAERMAVLGEMSAKVAHEIRNPLASITGSAQLLRENPDVEHPDKRLLQLIVTESRRLNAFLGNLLEYARDQIPTYRWIKVDDLFKKIRLLIEKNPNFAENRVQWEQEIETETLEIQTDQDILTQIILNLCINSMEAILPGEGKIRLSARKDGQNLQFRVSDTGLGMTTEVEKRIFEPFFTTKTGGSGLGLAVCLQLVQSLEGQISVESELGKGTSVSVLLPQQQLK